ncbi:hypothetical protein B7494_g8626 [Chlorociboria aeruginascens]|nr:hypothetical protein B7494_g8626 [Chlorociboria aeruginascens]
MTRIETARESLRASGSAGLLRWAATAEGISRRIDGDGIKFSHPYRTARTSILQGEMGGQHGHDPISFQLHCIPGGVDAHGRLCRYRPGRSSGSATSDGRREDRGRGGPAD